MMMSQKDMEQFLNGIPQSPQFKKQFKEGKIYLNKIPSLRLSVNNNQKDINFNASNWVQLDKFKIRPLGASPTSDRASTAMMTPSTLRRKVVKSSLMNSAPMQSDGLKSNHHSRTQSQNMYYTNPSEKLNQSMLSPQQSSSSQKQQLPNQQYFYSSQSQTQLPQTTSATSPFMLQLTQAKPQALQGGSYINSSDWVNEQKYSSFVKQYISTNELFTHHNQILQSLEYIPNEIKQTLDVLRINNDEKVKKKIINPILNSSTKSILFSLLEKLQKDILHQCRTRFHDKIIDETIVALNDVIPLMIRQLSDSDSHLSTFLEGFYKFFIIFMDSIQARIQYKIKREMNEKYLENEKIIKDQKLQISQLLNDVSTLQKEITEEQKNTMNVEGKLREEIISLKATIQEMKFNLEDMSNLDFAPAQLEKLAKTTNKMNSMIKKETAITQQAEIKAESQLLALSNVLLAISKQKMNDSDIFSSKNFFYSATNSKISRFYGDHPLTKCLHHINFLGMQVDEKSPKERKNVKQLLIQFYQKYLIPQRSDSNPCEQLIEYLQNEMYSDYEDVCQQIGYIIYYLKDHKDKDIFSYYFCQLFGLFDQPIPSKEELKAQIQVYQKLQQLNEERKNQSLDDDTQQISIAQFEKHITPFGSIPDNYDLQQQQDRSGRLSPEPKQFQGTLNTLNTLSAHNMQFFHSNVEFTLPLDTVFEEIPWSSIQKIFETEEWSLHFNENIKQNLLNTQISAVTFMSKLLEQTTIEIKDQQNLHINTMISKLPGLSTNQQKMNNSDLINLCSQFKIKHPHFVQYTLYLYQEEVQLKQKLLNNISAEIVDSEFNELLKNSFLQMLKLQKFQISPFNDKQTQNAKPALSHEVIAEEMTNTNNSLISNENSSMNTRKLFKQSFNKIKIQHTLSKLGSKSNLESPLEKTTPKLKLPSRQQSTITGGSSPKRNNDILSSAKFSKFKK